MDTFDADREEEEIMAADERKAERLQELARRGQVFICYAPLTKEKLHELELAKLARWNTNSSR